MKYIYDNRELYHYGVKGMKWGVRKKRYDDDPNVANYRKQYEADRAIYKSSKKAMNKASNRYNAVPTGENWEKAKNASIKFNADKKRYKWSKLQYTTNKEAAVLRDKGKTFKSKSKHRLKLEEEYKKLGFSDEQAQAAANKRIRTEKILAASAAMTVAACAVYIANKNRKNRIDGLIKAGESLQRIEMQNTGGKLNDMFYAAKGKHDSTRYKNLLGYSRQQLTGESYLMKLKANSDIKVASKENATKVFGDLYKNDSSFRASVKDYVNGHNNIKNINDVSNRNMRKMYENFNANIMGVRDSGSGADKKFYNKLKSAGYGAIQDINDMKFSGYSAKNPLIIFDNANSKNIMVESVSKLGDLKREGTNELLKATGETMAKEFLEKAGPMSAAALTTTAAVTYTSKPTNQYKNVK